MDGSGQDGAGRQRLTLDDVAQHLGVSRSTVSLVLRDSPLVARETRERVQAGIAELGYVYNRSAATMRANRTGTVGLLVCEITNPFFAELTAGVDQALEQAGLLGFLGNTAESPERQERFLQRMREQNVDGVILCPAAGTQAAQVEQIHRWGMPCVQALRCVKGTAGDYAGADYEFGMEQVTEHLIRLGHRRIAYIGGDKSHSASIERRAGFVAAMRRHGLEDPGLVVRSPLTRQAGADAIAALLRRPDPPTAAVCFNDIVAFGVMHGLDALGLRAGRDVAVTGFDDVAEAALSRPALTTVATTPRQIGEEAAKLLVRRIASPNGAAERVILPARLIVRESCGAMERRGATGRRTA
jgi:LacI family transcriptional regulator